MRIKNILLLLHNDLLLSDLREGNSWQVSVAKLLQEHYLFKISLIP
jgi:uncharacterized membrane protein